ncbi:MAG: hypothetical protein JXJ04_22455 [Spirochaetales bacterium]|nr:hypothetical protein [Spirochaetales bacterium]
MEERIDFFGKYSEKMTEIHEQLFNDIAFDPSIDKAIIERSLLQCNYSEYIDYHPEESEYYFDLYDFRFRTHTGQIMTAFNQYFFKYREDYSRMIDSLKHSWMSNAGCSISFTRNCLNIDDLNFDTYDMMQTAHFLYPKKELLNNKINYQLFKIIYPYKTLEPLLRSWD